MRTTALPLRAALLTASTIAALAALTPVATAAPSNDLLFWPGDGKDVTPISVVTPGPCPASTKAVYGVAYGHGFGETGQIIVPTTPMGFSVTGRFAMPLQSTFNFYAQENATVLRGAYRIELICTDATASTEYARFRGEMRFADPHSFKAASYVPPSEPAERTTADDAPGANRVPPSAPSGGTQAGAAQATPGQSGTGANPGTNTGANPGANAGTSTTQAAAPAAPAAGTQSNGSVQPAPANGETNSQANTGANTGGNTGANTGGNSQANTQISSQAEPAAAPSNHLWQWGFALAGLLLIGVAVRGMRRPRG